jgi:hypothetical protein
MDICDYTILGLDHLGLRDETENWTAKRSSGLLLLRNPSFRFSQRAGLSGEKAGRGGDADDCGSGEAGVEGVMSRAHLSAGRVTVVVVSLTNICLLVTAAFHKRSGLGEDRDSVLRVKLGYVAITLALCSQILYCMMLLIWRYGWVPFYLGSNSLTHLEEGLSNFGGLLSTGALLMAIFGTGIRRYAGVWAGVTTICLWGYVGLGVALQYLFR